MFFQMLQIFLISQQHTTAISQCYGSNSISSGLSFCTAVVTQRLKTEYHSHTHPITHQLLKPCFCSRTKCTASLSTVFIVSCLLQQHPNLNRTKSHWSETQCSNQGVKVYLVSMDPECNGCRQQSEGHLSWKTLICGDTAGWFYCDLYLKLPSVIFLRYENANGSVREMMQAQCICYRKRKRRWGGQTGIGQTADCLSFLSVNHACSFLSFSDLL